jgi:H+/gluconate symporter-like permease
MSAVLLLGLLIWFLLRIRYLRWADLLLCGSFGFLLAKTVAAPVIQTVLDGVSGFLAQLHF